MKYWVAVGTPQNWKTAFDLGNTWGLKNKGPQATSWKEVQIGDVLIFYVVSPVKGIIGYGVVQQKLKQDTPLWPEESAKKEVVWPLRLIFEVRSCLPPDRWLEDKVVNDRVSFRAKMGFRLIPENLATEVLAPFRQISATSAEAEQSLHGQIVDWLLEIGKLQNYLCQKEYPRAKRGLTWYGGGSSAQSRILSSRCRSAETCIRHWPSSSTPTICGIATFIWFF